MPEKIVKTPEWQPSDSAESPLQSLQDFSIPFEHGHAGQNEPGSANQTTISQTMACRMIGFCDLFVMTMGWRMKCNGPLERTWLMVPITHIGETTGTTRALFHTSTSSSPSRFGSNQQ